MLFSKGLAIAGSLLITNSIAYNVSTYSSFRRIEYGMASPQQAPHPPRPRHLDLGQYLNNLPPLLQVGSRPSRARRESVTLNIPASDQSCPDPAQIGARDPHVANPPPCPEPWTGPHPPAPRHLDEDQHIDDPPHILQLVPHVSRARNIVVSRQSGSEQEIRYTVGEITYSIEWENATNFIVSNTTGGDYLEFSTWADGRLELYSSREDEYSTLVCADGEHRALPQTPFCLATWNRGQQWRLYYQCLRESDDPCPGSASLCELSSLSGAANTRFEPPSHMCPDIETNWPEGSYLSAVPVDGAIVHGLFEGGPPQDFPSDDEGKYGVAFACRDKYTDAKELCVGKFEPGLGWSWRSVEPH